MTCQDMMDLMQRNLDLDLTAAEEQALLAHLQGCPECEDLYERLKLLSEDLAQLPKVMPPYSIVDSIMHQLEELEGHKEPSAASDDVIAAQSAAEFVPDELELRRNKKGLFSWKNVSGVAAAGIVLGMFILNGGSGPIGNWAAENMLQPKQEKASQSLDAGSEAPASDTLPISDILMGNADKTEQTVSPQQNETSKDVKAVTKSPAASTLQSVASAPHYGKEVTMASPLEGLNAVDQNGKANQSPTEESVAGGDQAVKTKGAGDQNATSLKAPAASSGAKGTVDDSTKQDTAVASKDQAGTTSLALPSESSPAAKKELKYDIVESSLRSSPPLATVAPTIQPITTADGRYTAALDVQTVVITSEDGSEWFRSSVHMAAGEILTFKGWTEGTIFVYSIKKTDGQETTYRISAEAKQETSP